MKTNYLISGLAFLLISCAVQVKDASLKRRTFDDVSLNTTLKSELGDKLLSKGEQDFQDAYKIIETPTFKVNTVEYPYKVGDILPFSGSTKEWNLYYLKSDAQKRNTYYNGAVYTNNYYFGIAVNKKNELVVLPFLNSATGALGGLSTKKIEGFKAIKAEYTNSKCNNCFKQEFIFNGKVNNSLKFIYREYIEDFARPAFTQELQYDLNDSSIIGFKGLRLQVINATNTNIEYKVLNSFSER